MPSLEPLGTVLSGPDGNARTSAFTRLGCPVLSGGTPHFTELLLVEARPAVLGFLQEVALRDGAANDDHHGYRNPEFQNVAYRDLRAAEEEEDARNGVLADWSNWQDEDDDDGGGDGGSGDTTAATKDLEAADGDGIDQRKAEEASGRVVEI